MPAYITIDSGTTNTRVSLVNDGLVIDTLKFNPAASNVEARKELLKLKLKDGIKEILARNRKSEQDISRIIACGMITSEIGLIKLDHIDSPCGINELSANLFETVMDDISTIPFVFVRGVKIRVGEYVDVMRGEETEIYGISEAPEKNSLYVLPGSHSKLIYIDDDSRISYFSTELTGEMIGAIAGNTILKNAVSLEKTTLDAEYLQKGYLFSCENGMNAALFKVRMLKNFNNCTDAEVFSFFIGSVLAPEIDNIIKSSADKVIVGGKNQLKAPTVMLLKLNSHKRVEAISEEAADFATAYGCVRIYEKSLER